MEIFSNREGSFSLCIWKRNYFIPICIVIIHIVNKSQATVMLFSENKAVPTHAANSIQQWAWNLVYHPMEEDGSTCECDAMSHLPPP